MSALSHSTHRTYKASLLSPWLVCSTAAFVLMGAVAYPYNTAIFMAIQSQTMALPDALWSCLTVLGSGLTLFALLAIAQYRWPGMFISACMALVVSGLSSRLLKTGFDTLRPAGVLSPEQLHVVGQPLLYHSFPSGHTIAAFSFAALVMSHSAHKAPAAAWALPLAIAVGLSRMAVGAHWPIDVCFGAAVGLLTGALSAHWGQALYDRWQLAQARGYRPVTALVAAGCAVALFRVDQGYPLAEPFLQGLAAVLLVMALPGFWPRTRHSDMI